MLALCTFTLEPSRFAHATDLYVPRVETTITVGDAPRWITVGSRGVYISNANSNNISVIDPASNTVVATLTAPHLTQPQGAAVVGDKLFVTSSNSKVIIFSTVTNTLIGEVSVGLYPVQIKQCGSYLYVANHDSGSLSVIDPASNSLATGFTNPIALGHANTFFLGADENHLYAINVDVAGTMSVINCTTNTIESTQNAGNSPSGIAVGENWVGVPALGHPTMWFYDKANAVSNTEIATLGVTGNSAAMEIVNGRAYFGGSGVPKVGYVDVSGATVDYLNLFVDNPITLPAGSEIHGMLGYGHLLFVCGRSNSPVNVIDTDTETVIASLPAGNNSVEMGSSGRFVYVVNTADGTVTVISAAAPSDTVPSTAPPTSDSTATPVLTNTGLNAELPALVAGGVAVAGVVLAAVGFALKRRRS